MRDSVDSAKSRQVCLVPSGIFARFVSCRQDLEENPEMGRVNWRLVNWSKLGKTPWSLRIPGIRIFANPEKFCYLETVFDSDFTLVQLGKSWNLSRPRVTSLHRLSDLHCPHLGLLSLDPGFATWKTHGVWELRNKLPRTPWSALIRDSDFVGPLYPGQALAHFTDENRMLR